MAMYRCTESFVVGSGDEPEEEAPVIDRVKNMQRAFVEDRVYDDSNAKVKAAIKRFPERFSTEAK